MNLLLMKYLISKFQEAYTTLEFISTDEEILPHKGKLELKQYIPNKRARFGIKFLLCVKIQDISEIQGYILMKKGWIF